MASEQELIQLVKSIKEPTNLENLMKATKIIQLSSAEKKNAKELLVELLGAGVRLGFIYEYKEHYCDAAHVNEMIALMESDSQSDLDTSSESIDGWGGSGHDES